MAPILTNHQTWNEPCLEPNHYDFGKQIQIKAWHLLLLTKTFVSLSKNQHEADFICFTTWMSLAKLTFNFIFDSTSKYFLVWLRHLIRRALLGDWDDKIELLSPFENSKKPHQIETP